MASKSATESKVKVKSSKKAASSAIESVPAVEAKPVKATKKASKSAAVAETPASTLPVVEAPAAPVVATPDVRETAPVPRPAPTHDEIARRAYQLWLSHGGSSSQNWFEAETQLRRG